MLPREVLPGGNIYCLYGYYLKPGFWSAVVINSF